MMDNYFELFSLPVSFKPDKTTLRAKYFELSKQYHPDYFAQATEEDQQLALEKSSQVNKGYKTLSSPDATLRYVLLLQGAMEEEEGYTLPPGFLMEMLELNEAVEDTDGDEEQQQALKKQLAQLHMELYNEVAKPIENYNATTSTIQDLQPVKEYYFKKKYLDRITESLSAAS